MSSELTARDLRRPFPARKADAHKGDFGHVLVVAGSRGLGGAAALCARAALRGGAGLVTAAVPECVQPVVAAAVPEAMTLPLAENAGGGLRTESVARILALHRSRAFSALALGPGLGTHPDTARAVVAVLGSLPVPAVVDADALNLLALQPREAVHALFERRGAPSLLTPHPGEAARLLRTRAAEVQSDRRRAAASLAEGFGCVVLLKGHRSVATDGKTFWTNPSGNPGLAKGGSGDALTGLAAALLAQHPEPSSAEGVLECAALAAWLHGLAADRAVREKTPRCLLASDVIEAFPHAFRKAGL